jgi:hypothetical protein
MVGSWAGVSRTRSACGGGEGKGVRAGENLVVDGASLGIANTSMNLATELHSEQSARWPRDGRHILAHHDSETIIVYQAFQPSIGDYAIKHGVFGFSYSRMSWIKPNFLWMMYRSGWGTKENQETTLALRLRRKFFDSILAEAVASSFGQSDLADQGEWKAALETSDVRLQWDPDHGPNGNALARRALQLGLRGSVLAEYGKRELLEVIDMTEFVAAQREVLASGGIIQLQTPREDIYQPSEDIKRRLKMD